MPPESHRVLLRDAVLTVEATLAPLCCEGGDGIDLSMENSVLHFAILDAMGHGAEAAQLAHLALETYRSGRRERLALDRLHEGIDTAITRSEVAEGFVTGQLGMLESRGGMMAWTNAGHPPPILLRRSAPARELASTPTCPWGLGSGVPDVSLLTLEKGDRLVFYTDGLLNAIQVDPDHVVWGDLADWACSQEPGAGDESGIADRRASRGGDESRWQRYDDAAVLVIEWAADTRGHEPTQPSLRMERREPSRASLSANANLGFALADVVRRCDRVESGFATADGADGSAQRVPGTSRAAPSQAWQA